MADLHNLVALVTGSSRGGGRGIALELGAAGALAADEQVMEKSGQLLEVGTLARDYGFTDLDGSQPPPFRILASA